METVLTMKMIRIMHYIYVHDKPTYSEVSKGTNTFFSHVHNLITLLKKKGYIITERKGREVRLSLTELGKEVGRPCSELITALNKKNHGKA